MTRESISTLFWFSCSNCSICFLLGTPFLALIFIALFCITKKVCTYKYIVHDRFSIVSKLVLSGFQYVVKRLTTTIIHGQSASEIESKKWYSFCWLHLYFFRFSNYIPLHQKYTSYAQSLEGLTVSAKSRHRPNGEGSSN